LTGGSGQDGTRLWKTNITEPEKDRSRTVDWQEPDFTVNPVLTSTLI
jgi:hypothetical protein